LTEAEAVEVDGDIAVVDTTIAADWTSYHRFRLHLRLRFRFRTAEVGMEVTSALTLTNVVELTVTLGLVHVVQRWNESPIPIPIPIPLRQVLSVAAVADRWMEGAGPIIAPVVVSQSLDYPICNSYNTVRLTSAYMGSNFKFAPVPHNSPAETEKRGGTRRHFRSRNVNGQICRNQSYRKKKGY
jgi:hypothetical protein